MFGKSRRVARELEAMIEAAPFGLRKSDLAARLAEQGLRVKDKALEKALRRLEEEYPTAFARIGADLYAPAAALREDPETEQDRLSEAKYYDACAAYLRDELGAAKEVEVTGRASFKFGAPTPDLLGVDYLDADSREASAEIVAVELKDKPSRVATDGLRQALVYGLFADKVFIATPPPVAPLNMQRLEIRCRHYGVGLIYFDPVDETPVFERALDPRPTETDPEAVEEMKRALKATDEAMFGRLFGEAL
ncbi:MAG: hypothetical protein Tsb0010_05110 [Parvularculaceae bacterium]